jgi:hypothetical protein
MFEVQKLLSHPTVTLISTSPPGRWFSYICRTEESPYPPLPSFISNHQILDRDRHRIRIRHKAQCCMEDRRSSRHHIHNRSPSYLRKSMSAARRYSQYLKCRRHRLSCQWSYMSTMGLEGMPCKRCRLY